MKTGQMDLETLNELRRDMDLAARKRRKVKGLYPDLEY
jgi:hypothetical protein